ncbi:regucalcin-like [Bacillus rossius redtenbacheri]|uniref:regucalcin-like n=1 Tax=Bacillus rossius redtenbacheri TaxID=93214 RepID=UPI002FDD8638
MRFCVFAGFIHAAYWSACLCEVRVTPVVRPLMHSEGPHWDEEKGVLFYVDIHQQLVNRYDPATGEYTCIKLEGGPVSLVIPVKNSSDQFVATRGLDLVVFSWDGRNGTGPVSLRVLASVDADKPGNRFNDGKADTSGRIWAGTMGPEPTVGHVVMFQGSLYSLDPGQTTPVTHVRNASVSNGLAWNARNNVEYWIDSPTYQVAAFNFSVRTAKLDFQHTVFDVQKNGFVGFPDGMTIDSNGNLWVACFNCWKVLHLDPRTQRLLGAVDLPAARVTSVMFGGPKLDTLYVTTSSFGLTPEEAQQQPLAGSVFAVTGLGARALAPANKAVVTA